MSTIFSKKINDWLLESTESLKKVGIATARLDALLLLENVLKKDRTYILANPDQLVSRPSLLQLDLKLKKRLNNLPIAYITGEKEFYGHIFFVNDKVLIPRPETENIIELLKEYLKKTEVFSTLDVGTGSGCIGISIALEFPKSTVTLSDISISSLKVAKRNSKLHRVNSSIIRSDLLNDIDHDYEVIVANLPYVPVGFKVGASVKHEPKLALYSGEDGMNEYRRFWIQVGALNHLPKYIATESFPKQQTEQQKLAKAVGYKLLSKRDFIQLFIKDNAVLAT
jgi:release factor glutamine methyltransferase